MSAQHDWPHSLGYPTHDPSQWRQSQSALAEQPLKGQLLNAAKPAIDFWVLELKQILS